MIKKLTKISFCALIGLSSACRNPISTPSDTHQTIDNDIHSVGSSTANPFITRTAQEFRRITGYEVIVESTGSSHGHKLFCQGTGLKTPDITTSSRRQKKSEFDLCKAHGVEDIIEAKLGFDGIVIANKIDARLRNIGIKDVYLALAKNIPVSDTECTLQANPYSNWNQINPNFPDQKIKAYGPPPTSGTRDAFVELAMKKGAKTLDCLVTLHETDPDTFTDIAHTLREDGIWIDAGENDNALVQTLINTPTAIGILGYSFLDQNSDMIKGINIDGTLPTFENISSGDYPLSRTLYFYIKKDHIGKTTGLKDYALELISDHAAGPGGYLEEIGLVPLPKAIREHVRTDIQNQTSYSQ